MANIVELKNVNKFYGTTVKTQVLFNIDLSFEVASFNSIIGQSGSGKSTLLNILGTLDRPTDGQVLIDGRETGSMKNIDLAALRNRTIGFIFQFHYLLPEFTALENVLMPFRVSNSAVTKEAFERAEELMEIVGISHVKNNLATRMSGGQQQRTAIARALINNPRVVLADEPTGNLDSDTSEKVFRMLREINERFGTTFVIVTHDRRIAEETDRIVEIVDGRIRMDLAR